MNTNGQMVSCEDCVYDNKFGSVIKRWTDEYLEKEDK